MIAFEKIVSEKKNLSTVMLTIFDEGSSLKITLTKLLLMIVNETTNFVKKVVFGKTIVFEKNMEIVTSPTQYPPYN